MPMEIEAKMKVDDLASIRAKLAGTGARRLGAFNETNTFFDSADRVLVAGDKGLRLRINQSIDTGKSENIITYKGPRQEGPLKNREEVELTVDDERRAARLFECLGFIKTLSFEKRREYWELDDCEVTLDELPHLGTFVEIEGPGEGAILAVRKRLALDTYPLIKTGYAAMIETFLRESKTATRDVRF